NDSSAFFSSSTFSASPLAKTDVSCWRTARWTESRLGRRRTRFSTRTMAASILIGRSICGPVAVVGDPTDDIDAGLSEVPFRPIADDLFVDGKRSRRRLPPREVTGVSG